MKLNTGYYYVVLCEDRQTQSFLLHFLKHQGVNKHNLRLVPVPGRKGSGEAYVRNRLAIEVNELKRKNYNKTALVVCTDADNLSVEERIKCLNDGVDKYDISDVDNLMIWCPKRHIETWIKFLSGDSMVDEYTIYRHTGKPVKCKRESIYMSELFQKQSIDESMLPSMKSAKRYYDHFCEQQK